jgi:hypothetical protein
MPVRPWSRLALALLLLWQLQSAVAVAVPHALPALQASGAQGDHCARHAAGDTGQTAKVPGAPEPGCCHDAPASCHCTQLPALALPVLAFGEPPPPETPPLLRTGPRSEARSSDFFRPPI